LYHGWISFLNYNKEKNIERKTVSVPKTDTVYSPKVLKLQS
jgi:hypothetical protein